MDSSNNSVTVPSAARARKAMTQYQEGNSFTDILFNGREVTFKAMIVPPDQLHTVQVWAYNERDQDALNEESLSDILPSIRSGGQTTWALGRLAASGCPEAADGSRRLAGVRIAAKPFKILVADLTDDEMEHISLTGNFYDQPSPIEKGRRYKTMVKRHGSQRAVEQILRDKGEAVSRRTIERCIKASELPRLLVNCYPRLADITAELGERLSRSCLDDAGNVLPAVEAVARAIQGTDQTATTVTRELILAGQQAPQKPKPVSRTWGDGKAKTKFNDDKLTLTLSAVDEDTRYAIEQFLTETLGLSADE